MIQLPFLPKTYHRMRRYVPNAESILAPSVTIKQPTVWDVSFYNGAINWSTVSPRPFGVIVKATEWTSTDPQFISNWQQLGALNIPRACYHFYHNGQIFYNSARQANAFVAAIQKAGGFTENDYFIIDDEETDAKGNSLLSAGELVDFLYNVQIGLGLKDTSHLLIYSTASLLNNLSFAKLTAGQPQWIKQIRVWSAGYPNSPDSFSTPPAAYTPDQSRYGKVVLWQYSDSVAPFGDINWIDPAFANEWVGQTGPLPPNPPAPSPITINDIEIKVQDNQLQSVDVDGVDYTSKSHLTIGTTPLPAPQPQPAPTDPRLGRYRILNDWELPASYYNGHSRTAAPTWTGNPSTPETCRINSSASSFNLSDKAIALVHQLNDPLGNFNYVQAHQGGWVNYGTFPTVECLTFGNNFVDVISIDDSKGRAYIRTWDGTSNDDEVVHQWWNVNNQDGLFQAHNGKPGYIVLEYPQPAWIPLDKLVKVITYLTQKGI